MGCQPAEDIGAVLKACDFEGIEGLSSNATVVVDRDGAIVGTEQAEPELGAGRGIGYVGLVVPIVFESEGVT